LSRCTGRATKNWIAAIAWCEWMIMGKYRTLSGDLLIAEWCEDDPVTF